MTEAETLNAWQDNNDRYLAAALAWLRRRLRRLADEGRSIPSSISRSMVTCMSISESGIRN